MPPLSTQLRLYCERTSDLLTGEPINSASNLAFFLAAFLLLRCYRHNRPVTGKMTDVMILIALTFIVGTGSLIFHTVATMGAALFDMIPIACFIFFYLYVFARELLGFNRLGASALLMLLVAINIAYKFHTYRAMDGYVSYIPTFLFLAALSLYLLIRRHASALPVLAAAALALVSLYCRTIDRAICVSFPLGTHFLWHGLNAIVIYILVREIILSRTRTHDHR